MRDIQIIPLIGVTLCAVIAAACNDVSRTSDHRAPDTRSAASSSSVASMASTESTATQPQAVPVPPASSSSVVTGAVEESTATETPVDFTKLAASTIDSAPQDTMRPVAAPAEEASSQSPSSGETKGGIDSAATKPLSTLNAAEESKSMPMAGHGNNHSSPSLEQSANN